MKAFVKRFSDLVLSNNKYIFLFALEGMFLQFMMSINGNSQNLYATALGASDSQIGMIHIAYTVVTMILLLPIGIIANRIGSKKLLILVAALAAIMYIGLGSVPMLGKYSLLFFFVFLGLGSGLVNTYNSQWQSFFGGIVSTDKRNDVYATRNKLMTVLGILIPIAMGYLLGVSDNNEGKIIAFRCFYYAGALFLILLIIILLRFEDPSAKEEKKEKKSTFAISDLKEAFFQIIHDKNLKNFFITMLVFYMAWQLDWSMWYISEVQYCGFTSSSLSYYNAFISVIQFIGISMWVKINRRKGVIFSMFISVFGIAAGSVGVIFSLLVPTNYRILVFTLIAVISTLLQAGMSLAMVQLILDNTPEKNRSVIISIYTMLTTLSNCIMPYLGVQLYTALGANERALMIYYVFVLSIRAIPAYLFYRRYRASKVQ